MIPISNELVHATVGTTMTQIEFEAVGLHVCNSQATGDLIYGSSATQLSRLGIGTTNAVLQVVGGIPAWVTNPTIASPNFTGTVNAAAITSTGRLTVAVAGVAADIQNTTDAASNEVALFRGGNRATPADNDRAYISLTLDNDAGTQIAFAQIDWTATDVTNSESDGEFLFKARRNNAMTVLLELGFDVNSSGVVRWNGDSTDVNYTWNTDASSMTLDGGTNLLTFAGASTSPSYHELTEMAAPGAGGANTARIYAVVGGDTFTDLAAVFQDGTVDIFAQEVTPLDSPILTQPSQTEVKIRMVKEHPGLIQFVAEYLDGKRFVLREIQYHDPIKIAANKGAENPLPLNWIVESAAQRSLRLGKEMM